ncbi:glycine zipper family protein [Rhodopirellula sallentina]|nr:glycine zipper family protein [Rhodopirellula sallentina]
MTMKLMHHRCLCWSVAALGLVSTVGCQTTSHMQQDAAVGTFLGSAAGAVIGHQSGHAGEGALIGAATGAVAGAIVGDAKDAREERDAALSQVSHPVQDASLTNFDLIRMSQSGLGDSVIINTVQTRGGTFDLSPDGLINLKSNGVSDGVIVAVQSASQQNQAAGYASSSTTYVSPSSSIYVVAPQPAVRVVAPVRRAPVVRTRPRRSSFHFRF